MSPLVAEFDSAEAAIRAVRAVTSRGGAVRDVCGPSGEIAIEEALGLRRSRIPGAVLAGALAGAAISVSVQWWTAVIAQPLDVGGRPLASWLAYVPITVELAVLGGSFAAVAGLAWATGLPKPYDALFEVEGFERVTVDRWFVIAEGEGSEPALREAGALAVRALPPERRP